MSYIAPSWSDLANPFSQSSAAGGANMFALTNPLTSLPVVINPLSNSVSQSVDQSFNGWLNRAVYAKVPSPSGPPSYGLPDGALSNVGVTDPNAIDKVITNQQQAWNDSIFTFFKDSPLGNSSVIPVGGVGDNPTSGMDVKTQIAIALGISFLLISWIGN